MKITTFTKTLMICLLSLICLSTTAGPHHRHGKPHCRYCHPHYVVKPVKVVKHHKKIKKEVVVIDNKGRKRTVVVVK